MIKGLLDFMDALPVNFLAARNIAIQGAGSPFLWKVRDSRRWLYFPKKDKSAE